MKAPEIRFKRESVEELLEERKPGMEAVTYQQVKKTGGWAGSVHLVESVPRLEVPAHGYC